MHHVYWSNKDTPCGHITFPTTPLAGGIAWSGLPTTDLNSYGMANFFLRISLLGNLKDLNRI